jgi:hypothetical protein
MQYALTYGGILNAFDANVTNQDADVLACVKRLRVEGMDRVG